MKTMLELNVLHKYALVLLLVRLSGFELGIFLDVKKVILKPHAHIAQAVFHASNARIRVLMEQLQHFA